MWLLFWCAVAYLAGSVPFGLVIGKWFKGVDVRQHGSGNIGAANVFRVLGKTWGVLVLLLDAAKGYVPVMLAGGCFHGRPWEPTVRVLVAAAAILGHNNSIFLGFSGGKGIATTFGVFLAISPLALVVSLLTWAVVVFIWRYSSLGSLCAAASIPVTLAITHAPRQYVAFGVVALVLAVIKHRKNIAALRAGTERKIFVKTTATDL
jgi:glycerol-3-phosphate acyltransferase PlsY